MDYVRATDIAVGVARVAAIAFGVIGLFYGALQLLVLAPLLWVMGTRERMLARAIADDHAGPGGVEVLRRDRHRSGRSRFFGGGPESFDSDHRDRHDGFRGYDDGPAVRRFTIRQVGGRLVIETLD
jgi:hypothetical protein